jgi:predicted MFS family arabinose efflux permease
MRHCRRLPKPMTPQNKNVALLAACQSLLFTNNVILISVNGLAGYALAQDKALATLPITGYVVGSAVATLPVSLWMKTVGRRRGFIGGAVIGIFGAILCALAVAGGNFWLLCLGTLVMGAYNAAGQYYRFAAADVADASSRSRAISLVLAGGLVGGVVGPESSKLTKDLLAVPFLGSYASLVLFALATIFLLRFAQLPFPSAEERSGPARSVHRIAMQPSFLAAVLIAAIGYGVMNLLMSATPLAMGMCGHPYDDAALVIEWHVIGMFAPSFFTGTLIARAGVLRVISAGVALMAACVAIALSGIELAHFWWALLLLGVGWNFMFVGATSLLTESYRPAEKAKAQGVNDLAIFATMATSSVASGALVSRAGWEFLNFLAIPFVVLAGLCVLALRLRRR